MNATHDRKGVVLVITLSLLVVLTVLVIGFVTMTRTERQASRYYDREIAAQQLAEAGIMRVLATLKATMPATLDATRYYATMPGLIAAINYSSGAVTPIGSMTATGFLYSRNGTAVMTGTPNLFSPAESGATLTDLNSADYGLSAPIIPQSNNYYVTGGGSTHVINAAWIPVTIRHSGTFVTDSGTTVLVGRYAYWTDDNSARISVNTAHRRSLPPAGSVSNAWSFDITDVGNNSGTLGGIQSITPTLADNLFTYRGSGQGSLVTTEQMKFATGMGTSNYELNKFYLTTGAVEDEIDVFGRSRLNFNTLTFNAGISGTLNSELYARLSNAATTSTTASGDWGLVFPGATRTVAGAGTPSFVDSVTPQGTFIPAKYPLGGRQLMANMIDFTKSRTSDCTMAPLAASGSRANLPVLNAGLATEQLAYLGIKKSLYLNEVIFNATGTAGTGGRSGTIYAGAIYIDYEMLNAYDLTLGGCQIVPDIQIVIGWISPATQTSAIFNTAVTAPNLTAHSYGTINNTPIKWTITSSGALSNLKFDFVVRQIRVLNSSGVNSSLRDYVAQETIATLNGGPVTFTILGGTTSPSPFKAVSYGKDDPRIPTTLNRFVFPGASPTPRADNPGLTWASGDGIDGGAVASHSTFYVQEGAIPSLGYLGYVHTGKPWRTLRLQPNLETNAVPDWALLDIFKLSDATTTSGRININARILDATTAPAIPPSRRAALMAILTNGGFLNNTAGASLYMPIANSHSIADAIINQGWTVSVPGIALMAGEVCQVSALNNAGTTDETKEFIIRQIAPHITARSTSHTVWCLAQTIKDMGQLGIYEEGIDLITGRALVQAVIECKLERDPTTGASKPSYRIVSLKHITE